MIIMLVLLFVAALPLFTGIYYTTVGIAKKQRKITITGIVMVIAWCVIMYLVSGSLYTLATRTE